MLKVRRLLWIPPYINTSRESNHTLIVCDESIDKQELLNSLDDVHPAIKFTIEEENDNSIAFRDVLISRMIDGLIKGNVFIENRWKGQYTHYHSFTPLQYKIDRIKLLCSENCVDYETDNLKSTFRNDFVIKILLGIKKAVTRSVKET